MKFLYASRFVDDLVSAYFSSTANNIRWRL